MRAVVVYESVYGNTHLIARAIGAGLATACDVSVVPVAEASQQLLAGADLVVAGGPTHVHGMSRESTRNAAVEAGQAPDSMLSVEPGAQSLGLREWFGTFGRFRARAAAFDTRVHGPAALTGRASKGIAHLLRAHGFELIAAPESFLVTKQNQLELHEEERARAWGAKLAAVAAPARPTAAGS
jgi:Flavodoxin domain